MRLSQRSQIAVKGWHRFSSLCRRRLNGLLLKYILLNCI